MENQLPISQLWDKNINPETEPYQIAITRGEWLDESRNNRVIAYKIYMPVIDDNQKFPIILWSHGIGGSRDGAGFISRFVASHGYIIVHIQHIGTDSSLWEGKSGHPWDVIRATHIPRRAIHQRFKDIPFVLNQLEKMDIAHKMDLSKIGMSGHSLGAMTTQVMAGQRRGYGARQYSLYEPRFKAGILYSPLPFRNKKGHKAQDFYGGIKIPLLIMTGTSDDNPLDNYSYKERLEVFEYSGGLEQHLLIMDKGDHMVFNGSRGKLDVNPKREIHEKIVKILSLAFWDAYLKDNNTAYNWLTNGMVQNWLMTEGSYNYRKNPNNFG